MRDEEIVDPREPGLPRHGRNPDGIAWAHGVARPRLKRAAAGKPRVDEQGLSRRRDQQRRLTTLDVDEVDVERVRRCARGSGSEQNRRRDDTKEDALQG